MIKKKINEDLKKKNIEFEMQGTKYKALYFYQAKMTIDVIALEDTERKGIQNIPFAHLPKTVKKLIKPN